MSQPSELAPSVVSCLQCGYNLTGAVIGGRCPECGAAIETSLRPAQPPRTSGTAVTSLVVGILGVLICGLVAPIAILLGIQALGEVRRGDCTPGSKGLAVAGIVLGIIGTVLIAGGLILMSLGGL